MEIWNRRNPVGGAPIVDSALDVNSEHCVQNKVVAEQFSAINSTLQWKTLATLTNIQPQQNLDLPTEYNEIIFTFYAADACYTYHFTKAIFDAIPNGCFIRGGYYYYNEDNGACFFKKNSNTQISLRTISKNFVAQTTNGIVQYR